MFVCLMFFDALTDERSLIKFGMNLPQCTDEAHDFTIVQGYPCYG